MIEVKINKNEGGKTAFIEVLDHKRGEKLVYYQFELLNHPKYEEFLRRTLEYLAGRYGLEGMKASVGTEILSEILPIST